MTNKSRRLRDSAIAGVPVSLALTVGVLPMIVLFIESIGPGVTTANYREALGPLYRGTLVYSLGVGIIVTGVCLAIAYPVTYWVAHRCSSRYRLQVLIALTLPLWLNYVVLNYSWVWILARGGLLNRILTDIGLINRPLDLLYTDVSMFIGFVYIYLPYVILTLYVSMERLDYRLIEAARDLGATNRRVFIDVILPSTLPGATAAALIVYARIAGAFATPAILGGPGNVMIASLIAEAFRQYFDYGFAAALSFVFLFIVVIALLAGGAIPQVREELRQW